MKIAVIGAGIAGLSTAYYLQKKTGAAIDIYEKDADIGGLAGTFEFEKTHLEKYYHHIFTHDRYCLDLIGELGLADRLIWEKTKTGFFSGGINYPFTTPLDLLNFKPLPCLDRIRFGLSSVFISRYKNVDKLETITTEEFIIKVVGKQGWEKIWKPMLIGKFGDNYNKIPAVWIWERIVQRFKSRAGGGKDEVLGYLKGSFRTLCREVLDRVNSGGGNIYPNSAVREIIIEQNRCRGILVNGERKRYDAVICTPALPVFVELGGNAPQSYLEPLRKVNYDCALVAVLVLKESLSDIYWLNISDTEIPFTGLIEHTNFISSQEYNGKIILYLTKYLSVDNKLLTMSDAGIIDLYFQHLKKIHPRFDSNMVERYYVFRDRYAQPIWPMSYSALKPAYKTPVTGLYMANTSQIYPNDRGINFSIKLGKEVAEVVAGEEL
jgi:protoporphyrinogen oxidase